MKEGYGDDEVTQYPTQVFSVNNWALKPNQPEEPPFIDHMLAICNTNELVAFKAPKPSSIAERVPQGTKPGAQLGHKKQSSSKQTFVSRKEPTPSSVVIIMVNVIPPDHVDDVPVVEPNQHDDVPVDPEPVLVDEDEDPKEDEFKEEEDSQEEEDDMEIDI
ncbi:hypothetical protein Tco_0255023 [Tanacetum coccineum]